MKRSLTISLTHSLPMWNWSVGSARRPYDCEDQICNPFRADSIWLVLPSLTFPCDCNAVEVITVVVAWNSLKRCWIWEWRKRLTWRGATTYDLWRVVIFGYPAGDG